MKRLALIVLAIAAFACTEKQVRTISPEADTVMDRLQKAAADNKFFFGQEDYPFYGYSWEYEEGRGDVKEVCGSHPAVLGCDLGHIELGDDKNLDGVPFDMMRQAIKDHYLAGGIVTISWHIRNPVTSSNAWDTSDNTVVASVLEGGSHHEMFLGWLEKAALFLESLTLEDGTKIPVIFRPWHEHTGSWFWWGRKICSTGEYVSLWKMTVDYMKNRGLDNLIMAYSPNYGGLTEQVYMERYPGDDYVDILGLDAYGDGPEFKEVLHNELTMLSRLGKQHNKQIALTECGMGGLGNPEWFTQIILKAAEDIPITYLLVWRNAPEYKMPNHIFAPYPGHASVEDFIQFFQDPRTLFLND